MADGGATDPRARVKQIIGQAEACYAARKPWESRWQEIADYVIPGIADFTSMRSPGEKRMTKVFDPTQIVANEMLAAGLHGEVTNPATMWIDGFDAELDGQLMDDPEVLVYCEKRRDILMAELNRPEAAFPSHVHEVYLTLPAIATACLFTGWSREKNCLSFQARHMAEIAIKESHDGSVSTVYRKWNWTIEQAAMKFGGDKLSPETQKKVDDPKRNQDKIALLHVVGPRATRNYASMRPDQKAIESLYIEIAQMHKIEEAGFDEPPLAVARWGKISGETYGNRSPGWNSLPDIKQLQLVDQDMTTYFQQMTSPTMLAPDDGFIGPYRMKPRGITYYRSENTVDQYKWWEPGGDPNAVVKWSDGRRDRIRLGFYLDLFDFAPVGQPITATEAQIRDGRRLRLLGPLYGRLQGELLYGTVMRADGLLERAYRYPPRPPIMAKAKLRPRFISPVQLAMKAANLQPLYRALELEQGVETAHPGTDDIVDWGEAKRWAYQQGGLPAKLLLPKAIVEANKAQAAALQQAQQAATTAQIGSQASVNIAKARQTSAQTEAGVL